MASKKWRCTVCGYIHEGPEPPEVCPVCGAPKSSFEEVKDVEETSKITLAATPASTASATGAAPAVPTAPAKAPAKGPSAAPAVPTVPPSPSTADAWKAGLYAMSYGMFVVTSKKDGRLNGQAANTVFQITSDPPRVALGINKNNLTHEFIAASGIAAVTVLGKGNMRLIKKFGFSSGRDVDKFAGTPGTPGTPGVAGTAGTAGTAGVDYMPGPVTGCPVLRDGVAYLELKILRDKSIDAGTHTLFVADVVGGAPLNTVDPITYAYYRANRAKPETVVDDIDTGNVVAALNLEYGANNRYRYQLADIKNPRVNSALEGVMRSEGDHIGSALEYLQERVAPESHGFSRTLMHMKLNLDFEQVARDTYLQFSKETTDKDLARTFRDQSRSEQGHVGIFQEMIEEMSVGVYPVVFYCPLCGWEIDFGTAPKEGDEGRCAKCGYRVRLVMSRGEWDVEGLEPGGNR